MKLDLMQPPPIACLLVVKLDDRWIKLEFDPGRVDDFAGETTDLTPTKMLELSTTPTIAARCGNTARAKSSDGCVKQSRPYTIILGCGVNLAPAATLTKFRTSRRMMDASILWTGLNGNVYGGIFGSLSRINLPRDMRSSI